MALCDKFLNYMHYVRTVLAVRCNYFLNVMT